MMCAFVNKGWWLSYFENGGVDSLVLFGYSKCCKMSVYCVVGIRERVLMLKLDN